MAAKTALLSLAAILSFHPQYIECVPNVTQADVNQALADLQPTQSYCTPKHLAEYPGGDWPKSLDSTVYWIGPKDRAERATGTKSLYYDPAKPTVIFMQGWNGFGKQGGVHACRRWKATCTPNVCHTSHQ